MLLVELAEVSDALAATSARGAKISLVADCLRAAVDDEVEIAVSYLAGELRQRRTGLGSAALRERPDPAAAPTLTLTEVDATFAEIADLSGPGSATGRRSALAALLRRATGPEQRLLAGLVQGEVRHGALEGIAVDAVARAAGLPLAEVRRAVMLRGALAPVARAALTGGSSALASIGLTVGRPVQPMLAQPAATIADALSRIAPAAVEEKLDGIRVQVHRRGPQVWVFTRSLDDITARVPEVVARARALPVDTVVLDGEALALRPDRRPQPFQVTAARAGTSTSTGPRDERTPLHPFFFDVLHLDGVDLLARPAAERQEALARVVPEELRIPRIVTSDPGAAADFLARAVGRGQEGVVVKALDAGYDAGRRGAAWLKVKPRHTLDLVVLAAEWGHGRRRGWLSNLHLGARDGGSFVMLGKTFKGLTDAMLEEQTGRLLELTDDPAGWVVTVRPELVVEVAFDGVQSSPRYPAGVALRFARVLRHRPDKNPAEADTIDAVLDIFRAQREVP